MLHLSNPRPAYARKNLREASVKVNVSAEQLIVARMALVHGCFPAPIFFILR